MPTSRYIVVDIDDVERYLHAPALVRSLVSMLNIVEQGRAAAGKPALLFEGPAAQPSFSHAIDEADLLGEFDRLTSVPGPVGLANELRLMLDDKGLDWGDAKGFSNGLLDRIHGYLAHQARSQGTAWVRLDRTTGVESLHFSRPAGTSHADDQFVWTKLIGLGEDRPAVEAA